jgi:transcription antitermination factor NusG
LPAPLVRRPIPAEADVLRLRDNPAARFPGYVAVAPTEDDRKRVYGTHRLVRLLPVKDQAGFVHELAQVQRALDSGLHVVIAPSVSVGQLARVRSGPLMGLEGEVAGTNGQTRFVMWVRMFQQAVQIEVDELDLEAM